MGLVRITGFLVAFGPSFGFAWPQQMSKLGDCGWDEYREFSAHCQRAVSGENGVEEAEETSDHRSPVFVSWVVSAPQFDVDDFFDSGDSQEDALADAEGCGVVSLLSLQKETVPLAGVLKPKESMLRLLESFGPECLRDPRACAELKGLESLRVFDLP